MPSVFRTHFKAIGFPLLLTQFGESIVYHFAGGGKRTMNAIVNRNQYSIDPATGAVIGKYTIRVLDDCTTGIQATNVNTGGDYVEIEAEEGDTQLTALTVRLMLSQDNGVIDLALAGS